MRSVLWSRERESAWLWSWDLLLVQPVAKDLLQEPKEPTLFWVGPPRTSCLRFRSSGRGSLLVAGQGLIPSATLAPSNKPETPSAFPSGASIFRSFYVTTILSCRLIATGAMPSGFLGRSLLATWEVRDAATIFTKRPACRRTAAARCPSTIVGRDMTVVI